MSGKVLSVADFEPLDRYTPTPREIEVRRRISVCVAAYAYEIANKPIMSDLDWDQLAQRVDRSMGTGHPLLDEFFVTQFSPMTAMWIHNHPELGGIKRIFDRYFAACGSQFGKPVRR